jgi:hypothetical protein
MEKSYRNQLARPAGVEAAESAVFPSKLTDIVTGTVTRLNSNLAEVVSAWVNLPEPLREAILLIVRSATKQSQSKPEASDDSQKVPVKRNAA